MIRTPLRPLARILAAREKGENPDAIERENIRQRHETMRDRARIRAEGRLFLLGATFFISFVLLGTMTHSGVPLLDGMRLASSTVRNVLFHDLDFLVLL